MKDKQFSPPQQLLKKRYEARFADYRAVLASLKEILEQTLSESALQFPVQARLKSFDSYFEKLLRLQHTAPGRRRGWEVNDLLGLRIICPFLEDVKKTELALARSLKVREIEDKASSYSFREFGYESVHILAEVPRALCLSYGFPEGLICEIQLRTILQQAWAEVEHELVYKGGVQPIEEPIKRKLAALKANLHLADTLFQEIRESQRALQQHAHERRARFQETIASRMSASESGSALISKEDGSHCKREKSWQPIGTGAGLAHHVDALLLKALQAHNDNKYEQAIAIYSSILKQKLPIRARSFLYNHRGMAYFSSRRYQKALHDFSIAVSLCQENDRAFYYRGLTHQLQRRYHKALDDFSSCLAINPDHVNALWSRAVVYNVIGDAEKAIADCKAVLEITPDFSEAKQLLNRLSTSP